MIAEKLTKGLRLLLFVAIIFPVNILSSNHGNDFISNENSILQSDSDFNYIPENLVEKAEPIIRKYCEVAGLTGLPEKVTLIAIKNKREMELWFGKGDTNKFVRSYKILAASGNSGPKLRRGDGQVPEGIYYLSILNPNSKYHLSMGINYPNEFDRRVARAEGRTNLGGDIYIHGKDVSNGCIAMGDKTIEELYYLVSRIGKEHVKVIIAPEDFRQTGIPRNTLVDWMNELYRSINEELSAFIK